MISYIIGKIYNKSESSVTVLTSGGIGYEVNLQVSKVVNIQIGDEIGLYIYMRVSDSAMELFGFDFLDERAFFELLISVKGVGPKGALNILALGSMDDIQNAISRGDVDYLTRVSGIGKRTAERIVVELKSKVESRKSKVTDSVGEVLGDVIDGLVALGYNKEDARMVAKSLDVADKTSEQLLREALKGIGK
mgnify:CR=1 FL=1